MAEYGSDPTQKAKKAAARAVVTPEFVHAWGQYGHSDPDVRNLGGWLVKILLVQDEPPPRRSGDNGRQRGERAHYEPCTNKERQAVWAQHGDWACAFVSAEEEQMSQAGHPIIHVNAPVIESAAMEQLGLNKRQAQALAEAHTIETTEPLDATGFFGDSS